MLKIFVENKLNKNGFDLLHGYFVWMDTKQEIYTKGHYMNGVIGIFDDLFHYVSAIDAQSFIFNFIGPFDFLPV